VAQNITTSAKLRRDKDTQLKSKEELVKGLNVNNIIA
jgi:hypothetical protein